MAELGETLGKIGQFLEKEGDTRVSRRGFLKALAAGGLATLGLGSSNLGHELKEGLKDISPLLAVCDFTPGIASEESKKRILGADYRSPLQLVVEYGKDYLERENLVEKISREHPKLAAVLGVVEIFKSHGQTVISVLNQTLESSGSYVKPEAIPLQNMLQGEIEVTKDHLGNPGFFTEIGSRPIIESLRRLPSKKVVNFSFQTGESGFYLIEKIEEENPEGIDLQTKGTVTKDSQGNEIFYLYKGNINFIKEGGQLVCYAEGKKLSPVSKDEYERWQSQEVPKVIKQLESPFVLAKGAYTKENAVENLTSLFEICRAFPDKLFVAAGGNYRDDVREARKSLAGVWPKNLILVAEWNSKVERPEQMVQGVDVYVDNGKLGMGHGSSLSTPVVSAIASLLAEKGLTIGQIKEKIFSFCSPVQYKEYISVEKRYVKQEARLLDLTKTKGL